MDIKAYNNHCLAQEEVTAQRPFDQKKLVYYVVGKRLTLADIDILESIHLQSDPALPYSSARHMQSLSPAITCPSITEIPYTKLGVCLTGRCYQWIDGSDMG